MFFSHAFFLGMHYSCPRKQKQAAQEKKQALHVSNFFYYSLLEIPSACEEM